MRFKLGAAACLQLHRAAAGRDQVSRLALDVCIERARRFEATRAEAMALHLLATESRLDSLADELGDLLDRTKLWEAVARCSGGPTS